MTRSASCGGGRFGSESSWRWNVVETGWQGGPFKLIAWLPSPNPLITPSVWIATDGTPGIAYVLAPVPHGEVAPVIDTMSVTGHFPYGLNVDPD